MKIMQRSILTGRLNTADLDITPEQFDRWTGGELVQVVMPHLSADEREFLINGTTAEERLRLLGEEVAS